MLKAIESAIELSFKSIWYRKIPTILTVLSISLSVALYVGVNKTKESARDAFSGAISKVDLIVGPRSGTLTLLLYSVFHVGTPNHNVSMKSVDFAKKQPEVDWVVPFSLGDGFSGYPVVGTTPEFFERFKIGFGEKLKFLYGESFNTDSEVVVGYEVANRLGLKIGDPIVLSHGHSDEGDGFEKHNDHPFKVKGIMSVTGTPIDRSVYCSLAGMSAIHEKIDEHKSESAHDHDHVGDDEHHDEEIAVSAVSGFFLGAKNRMEALNLQRRINTYEGDALLAILPGMAMAELWQNLGFFEKAMSMMSLCVVIAGICGLFVSLYIISSQRKQEIMILRAVGAGPLSVFVMLVGEAILLVLAGLLLGVGAMYVGLWLFSPWIETKFSVKLPVTQFGVDDFLFAGMMLLVGLLVGLFASMKSYRDAMSEGLGTRF